LSQKRVLITPFGVERIQVELNGRTRIYQAYYSLEAKKQLGHAN